MWTTAFLAAAISQQAGFRPAQLERIMEPNHRVIVMGDSFGVLDGRNVWPTALLTWPVELKALEVGATFRNEWVTIQAYADNERVDSIGTYEIYRDSLGFDFYTLPVWSVREVFGPVSGNVFSFHAHTLDAPLEFRPLFLENEQVAVGPPQQLAGNYFDMELELAEDEYYHLAGAIFTEENYQQGLYYSSLADNSWQMKGFGSDRAGTAGLDKSFSQEQLEHWLAATTLDVNQPVTVIYNFAMERRGPEQAFADYSNMINQTQSAANAVGLTNVWHCIIVPHAHWMSGLTESQMQGKFTQYHQQAFAVADMYNNVSVISLWAALDTMLLDGDDNAEAWLADSKWRVIQYQGKRIDMLASYGADLLDDADLHLNSRDAGAFMSLVMLDVIQSTPQGDYTGDGRVNLKDLLDVLDGWGQWYDLFDLLELLTWWTG